MLAPGGGTTAGGRRRVFDDPDCGLGAGSQEGRTILGAKWGLVPTRESLHRRQPRQREAVTGTPPPEPTGSAPDARQAFTRWGAWYRLVWRDDRGGRRRRAGSAVWQSARPEAVPARERAAVGVQRGRFALASRMRIPSISASNSGASSVTMAAARMAS